MGDEERRPGGDWTRRSAMAALAVGAAGASVPWARGEEAPARPRIATLTTAYFKTSHGQGINDRLMDGYGWDGRFHHPKLDVVSLYVDQRHKGDLTDERAARHPGLTVHPTIAEALTRGTDSLAVDGVVILCEHGDYLRDEKGRTHYPRFEFFQQVVEVFKRTGQSVPVFNDKHLSWNWEWARSMYDQARELGFALMAGSSLPVTWRIPELETPKDAPIREAVCVGYGGVDSYDFHGLESLQCMIERRKGGETGVKAVEVLRGDSVWRFLAENESARELFNACLCRSFSLQSPLLGYGHVFPELDQMGDLARDPLLYQIQYNDGAVGRLFMMSGLVRDFTVAMRLEDDSPILSTQLNLPGLMPGQTLPNFFSGLAHHIEALFLTGESPYPVERTLLTSGVLCAAVDLLADGRARMETPHLSRIKYQPPVESQFMRS